jgi:hypothetical protein
MILTIPESIDSAVTFYQSESVPLSEVYATFANKFPTAIMKIITITQEKRAHMLKLNRHRFNFMYGTARRIGYLLDPRYVSKEMSIELLDKIESII